MIFYLLAGPNGAGKSTLYRALVSNGDLPADIEFVNADEYEGAHLRRFKNPQTRSDRARMWAESRRAALLQAGTSFASETVFSHESKLALIQSAHEAGFAVVLYVVALDGPERLLVRVAQRVAEGGHDVPSEKILARYPRTIANLVKAVRMVDLAFLYDSQDLPVGAHTLVAVCEGESQQVLVKHLPQWAAAVLQLSAQAAQPSPN